MDDRTVSAAYSRWDGDTGEDTGEDTVGMDYDTHIQGSKPSTPEWCVGRRGLALKVFLGILLFLFGIILGYLARRHMVSSIAGEQWMRSYEDKYNIALQREIKPQSLESFLQYFSNASHATGSVGDANRIKYITHAWENNGFQVSKKTYKVLLSDPSSEIENRVAVVNERRAEVISIIPWDTRDPNIMQPFNAYGSCGGDSGECIAEGLPVFVNYGTKKDFNDLTDRQGVDAAKDHIVIMRYGKIHRGNMVKNAMESGAKAVLLFPDSKDYAQEGTTSEKVFPNTWWLPSNGTQRGTVYLGNGDPLSPGFPSIDGSYFIDESEAKLPTIPVQVISYDDAHKLLCGKFEMAGKAPSTWDSGNPDCVYFTGPGFVSIDLTLKVTVHNINQKRQITNVIATIPGVVEPDRYVIIGNHRDSWTYGAIDAGTGTAVLMEISKALGILIKRGWKPRRTIILASWDAKEYGMIGATEWVEENESILRERAVAYINLDAVVMGDYSFVASASPLLKQVIFDATKQVDCPHHKGMSVYQNWKMKFNMTSGEEVTPKVDLLGGGTDTLPFMHTVGIPSMEIQYIHNPSYHLPMYPLFGSAYDNFYSVKKFVDPDFEFHRVMAQVTGTILLELSDSLVLPIDATHYSTALQLYRDKLVDLNTAVLEMEQISTYMDYLNIAIQNFTSAAARFHLTVDDAVTHPLAARAVNDQLMKLERMFIRHDIALPNRPVQYKHVLYAPDADNVYDTVSLSGVLDSIKQFNASNSQSIENVKRQISLITLSTQAAAASLQFTLGQE